MAVMYLMKIADLKSVMKIKNVFLFKKNMT